MEVISIVGAKGGLGKTFLAVNIANYLVACGLDVLLIDCDFNTNGATNFMELNGLKMNEESTFHSLESILVNSFEDGENSGEKHEAQIKERLHFIPTSFRAGYANYKNFKLDELNQRKKKIGEQFEEWSAKYDVIIMDHAGGYTDLATFLLYYTSTILLVNMDNISGIKSARDLYKKMSMHNQEIVQCVNVLDESPGKESESILRKCYGFMEGKQYKKELARGRFLTLDQTNSKVLERISKEILPMYTEEIIDVRKKIIQHDNMKIREYKTRKWQVGSLVLNIITLILLYVIGCIFMIFSKTFIHLNVFTAIIWLGISSIISLIIGLGILSGISLIHEDRTIIKEVVSESFRKYLRFFIFWK